MQIIMQHKYYDTCQVREAILSLQGVPEKAGTNVCVHILKHVSTMYVFCDYDIY